MAQPDPTRVLLVDASQLVTEGLRVVLQRTQRFRVAGVAHTAGDALRCLRALLVDLVVTDIDLPGAAPLQTVRDAREHRPHSPVVVLSGTDAKEWVDASLENGAAAYLLKTTPVTELLPGDVILTGTPAGVGPMSPGQSVSVTIEGLGTLTNPVTTR